MPDKLSSGFVFPVTFCQQNTVSVMDAAEFASGLRQAADAIENAMKDKPYILVGWYGNVNDMRFMAFDDLSEFPSGGVVERELLERYIKLEAETNELP